MPELPEVETVTQSVKKHIMGKCFSSLDVNWKKVLDNFTFYDFQTSVKGRVVKNVYRRAKYIIIDFEPGILAIHLRMTGKLYLSQRSNLEKKHVSLCMKIDDNFLIFEDVRKFGRFYLYKDMNRKVSPLKKAKDAILVVTTNMTMDEQVDFIIRRIGF